METLPSLGQIFKNKLTVVRVTRVTAVSGLHRWIYYRNVDTDEFHCQRLDLFLKIYS